MTYAIRRHVTDMTEQQLDLPMTGEELKAEGIAQRLANERQEWLQMALEWLRCYASTTIAGKEFTVEQFRSWWAHRGYIRPDQSVSADFPVPSHPNSWGALANAAAKAGIIRATGRYVRSSRPSAHSRPIMVWTRGDKI